LLACITAMTKPITLFASSFGSWQILKNWNKACKLQEFVFGKAKLPSTRTTPKSGVISY